MSEENVVHGLPSTILPANYSLGTFMYQRLLQHIERGILFRNEVTGEEITYENFLQYSCRLANSLVKYGIDSQEIASICCENCIEYSIPVMACLFKGIPVCPTNATYTESEFIHAFNLIKPAVIFCSIKNVNAMLVLKKKFPGIKAVIVINSDEPISGAMNLTQFIDLYSDCVDICNYKPVEVDIQNHLAFILFSSGTTGLSKGVMLTHKNINVKNSIMLEPFLNVHPSKQSQHTVCFLPFYHAYGLNMIITGIMLGCTIIIMEKFDFESYLICIEKYKITMLHVVPPILQMFVKNPIVDQYDLSHVEHIIVGAASSSESLLRAVKERTGVKGISQAFGMTEMTVITTVVPIGDDRYTSCGKLLPYFCAVVKDLETGRRNLGPNQNGELCFKGAAVMKGYYKDEAANKEAFTADGYFRSGDIGRYDEEGYFYIVDRLKELIKYKGHQVPPAELEAVLLSNPKIKMAGVVGKPDDCAGELPIAFVVKQPDITLTEKEVMEYVEKFVSPAKYLRGGVVFVKEIPTSPSGKILRRVLRQWLKTE